jgi:uncharacterized protein (TIGR02117 family)
MKAYLFKLTKVTTGILFTFLALAATYLLAAVLLGLIPVNRSFLAPKSGIDLYIFSNGLHTDFVIPVQTEFLNWQRVISPDAFSASAARAPYIGFGWGDKQFYTETPTWDQLKIPVALKAVFLPSAAAMHVTYYSQPPPEGPKCRRITLSPDQYEQLMQYILNSFEYRSGQVVPIPGSGYTSSDMFYEATGKYHLFNTSNSWVARGLRRIGVRTALWAPFDRAIFFHLEKSDLR